MDIHDLTDDFDLEVYAPYLLNRAGARIASAFSRELKAYGISLQMWRVLAALWHGGELRLSDLSAVTSIEISTLSRIVGAMRDNGLVHREKGGGRDGREVRLTLTRDGRALTVDIIPLALGYEERLVAGLSPAEVATLKKLLVRIFDNMDGGGR